jgi:hypothetical protein
MTLLPFVKSRHAIQSEVDVGLMADAGGVAVTASGVKRQCAPRGRPAREPVAVAGTAPLPMQIGDCARPSRVLLSAICVTTAAWGPIRGRERGRCCPRAATDDGDVGADMMAAWHQMRQRGLRLGRDRNDDEGAAPGATLQAAEFRP